MTIRLGNGRVITGAPVAKRPRRVLNWSTWTGPTMTPRFLYLAGAALILLDAVAYSLGALRQLYKDLAPRDPYLGRRLLLNLMLANAGLYFTAFFAFAGAYAAPQSPTGTVVMAIALGACLYSVVTVPLLTPRDWVHSTPRGLAALAIAVGLLR